MHPAHGERDAQRVFAKFNLALRVPVSNMRLVNDEGATTTVTHIKVHDYVAYLLKHCPSILLGGLDLGASSEKLLQDFWTAFQVSEPGHVLFKDHPNPEEWKRIIPLSVHGDKGRTVRKTPVLVLSFEPAFGLPPQMLRSVRDARTIRRPKFISKLCLSCKQRAGQIRSRHVPEMDFLECPKKRKLNEVSTLPVVDTAHNNRGHSFLSHFLHSVVPHSVFNNFPNLIPGLLDDIAESLKGLYCDGLTIAGSTYKVALLGMKGDAEWHVDSGNFSRSFRNCGTANHLMFCPECCCGLEEYPLADLREPPRWPESLYTIPAWPPGQTPAMATVPFSLKATESVRLFRRDMFHTLKHGFLRDLIGSTLVFMSRMGYFDWGPEEGTSIEERLIRGFACFKLWAQAEGKSPKIRQFTRANLHYDNFASHAWLKCHGGDVSMLLEFLSFYLQLFIKQPKGPNDLRPLRAMMQAIDGALNFLGIQYSHGVALPRECGVFMVASGFQLLRGYIWLAVHCMDNDVGGFCLRPKVHYFHHQLWDMQCALGRGAQVLINPILFNCELCEDYIGRISLLSRRVSPKLCSLRVVQRHLVKMKCLLKRSGLVK